MTALSDRLNEAKGTDGLDVIVARADAKGHKVHRSVFAKAFNGDHAKRPQDATLRAFADGLGIDVNELRRICDMPEGEMGVYTGPDESARLNRDQRKALDRLIKTIVAQKEEGSTTDGSTDQAAEAQKTELEERRRRREAGGGGAAEAGPKAARTERSTGRAQAEEHRKLGEESQDDPNADPGGA